ncbi:MAG: AAA family ATPase [Proteobacteria bacterium]|nr:AAA family ATPase [Pseudomonadota bacterium]
MRTIFLPEFRGTDRYEIRSCLGRGGMGVVYEAYDRKRNALIALKTLAYVDPHSIFRFKQEFRSLQGLRHPNLVRLGELSVDGDCWFFTMELVDGLDLLSYLEREGDLDHTAIIQPESAPYDDTMPDPASMADLGPEVPAAPGRAAASVQVDTVRSIFAQLTRGLRALHRAGKVHCDVKPSNILVTPDQRVVLLDFGLILDVSPQQQQPAELARPGRSLPMGTPAYAAPELGTTRVGPAADWYSTGVVLYEVLTGRLPFSGKPRDLWRHKQLQVPRHPWSLAPNCPKDLADLCFEMLRSDPADRPSGQDIALRLETAERDVQPPARPAQPAVATPPFVGREAELAQLRDAYRATARGEQAICVRVRGESGVGKSALISHFVTQLRQTEDPTVLCGRCYERESVPYKALDGVIDALSQHWHQLAADEAVALVPRDAAVLARVFPVLGSIEAIAEEANLEVQLEDSQLVRQRTIAALRHLFQLLTERRPLIIVIDDLQWTDASSMALLAEILRPPEPPPLLLLTSLRDHSTAARPSQLGLPDDTLDIILGPLAARPARALAEWLLARLPARVSASASIDALRIVEETRGHPLYIQELVRHAGLRDDIDFDGSPLDAAIWSRISNLDSAARIVLTLVCLAEAPVPEHVIARSAGPSGHLPSETLQQSLSLLRTEQLVRSSWHNAEAHIEPFHDHVRRAVMANLSGEEFSTLSTRFTAALGSAAQPSQSVQHQSGSFGPVHLVRLEDMLWQRIVRLSGAPRTLIELIAIAGEPLPLRLLGRAAAISDAARDRASDVLSFEGLAQRVSRPDEQVWIDAHHDKVREAILEHIPHERARALHGQLALALKEWDEATPLLLATHWLAAGEHRRAAGYFVAAARIAADQLDVDRAGELYRQALAQLADVPDDERMDALRARAWIGLAEGMRIAERPGQAMPYLDRAEELATRHGMTKQLAHIHYLRGNLLLPTGEFEACLQQHEKALQFAQQAGSLEFQARALSGLGDAHTLCGRMISAHRYFDDCVAMCIQHGFASIEVTNMAMRGWALYYQNQLSAALRDCAFGASLAADIGYKRAEIVARMWLGMILKDMARLDQSVSELESAIEMTREVGIQSFEVISLAMLSKTLVAMGQPGDAESAAMDAVSIFRRSGVFTGPTAFGALAVAATSAETRRGALGEGEKLLDTKLPSNNRMFFYRDAMEAALAARDAESVYRYARALETFTVAEPTPWSDFFIARGRALADHLSGRRDEATEARLGSLCITAGQIGHVVARRALDQALQEHREPQLRPELLPSSHHIDDRT